MFQTWQAKNGTLVVPEQLDEADKHIQEGKPDYLK